MYFVHPQAKDVNIDVAVKGAAVQTGQNDGLESPRADLSAFGSTAAVLASIRSARDGVSRVDIARATGLSKAIVTERVRSLADAGLIVEAGELDSTGGRRATRLMLRDRLVVVGAEIAMTHIRASIINFRADVLAEKTLPLSMKEGPDIVLEALEAAIADLLASIEPLVLCGIGVGVAGPVEFSTGRPVHPPVHPDWHDQPVRDRLAVRFGVPAWVDNEVNLMALAEQELGAGVGVPNSLTIKIGSWVGAGLISNGKLHRGANGSAGSLVTSAGGDAIAARAEELAVTGQSRSLSAVLGTRPITAQLVGELAALGDDDCRQILDEAAEDIGRVISVLVDFFNPSLLVVAGGVTSGGDELLAHLRKTVYERSLALATRDLRIERSDLGHNAAIHGAALMATTELTSPAMLSTTMSAVAAQVARDARAR
ncbi:ROK family protein [Microbacterium sp. E-13]|uniref:ROK family transcriptional regulator n=1 Tax=Microbacterium sp. E-13 TaxID=3404048 RepID=UPI003CE70D65